MRRLTTDFGSRFRVAGAIPPGVDEVVVRVDPAPRPAGEPLTFDVEIIGRTAGSLIAPDVISP